MQSQSSYFPIEKLPKLFYDAVIDVCRQTEAPPEVVVPDTFALSSSLGQRRYKVRGLNGSIMPITLNTLSLAPTGTGKGESYRKFFQPFDDLELDESTSPTSGVTIDDLLLQNINRGLLMSALEGYGKSASIQLEDGYSFLDGPLMMRDVISMLPQVWSGPPSIKLGTHHANKVAIEACLAIGLRIQPYLFYDFLKRTRSRSRYLGLWARFMTFCYDPGQFAVTPCYAVAGPSLASRLPFMESLKPLLQAVDTSSESGEPARKVLVMDTYANAHLREITYWIKGQLQGEFHDIQDAAARAAENTLRLASNFHVVCQGEGPISRDMIERAWPFAYWSLGQFRNVFVHALQPAPKSLKLKPVKAAQLPSHQKRLSADMQFLLGCIHARSQDFGGGWVPESQVALLTGFHRVRLLKTLGWLVTSGWVEVAGSEGNGIIRLCPPQQVNALQGYMPQV